MGESAVWCATRIAIWPRLWHSAAPRDKEEKDAGR